MNEYKLDLFFLRNFPQDVVLPDIFDPCALVSGSKVENCLPDEKLLGE
jgi:hypothetical protein